MKIVSVLKVLPFSFTVAHARLGEMEAESHQSNFGMARELSTIEFVSDPGSSLGLCQGDCDTDEDCAGDLVCWQRNPAEKVPGCVGGGDSNSKADYCVMPSSDKLHLLDSDPDVPLGICQGDCDSHDDCVAHLQCWQRDANEEVPGCTDGYKDDSRSDYCVFPPITYLGSDASANPSGKFGVCQGDCDRDSDCEENLVCWQRGPYGHVPGCNGGESNGSRSDYCVHPNFITGLEKCKGDCDNNSDCQGNLICYRHEPYAKVPGCPDDETDSSFTDYCIDPFDYREDPLPALVNTFAVKIFDPKPTDPNFKFGICEGNCYFSSDCEVNLYCGQGDDSIEKGISDPFSSYCTDEHTYPAFTSLCVPWEESDTSIGSQEIIQLRLYEDPEYPVDWATVGSGDGSGWCIGCVRRSGECELDDILHLVPCSSPNAIVFQWRQIRAHIDGNSKFIVKGSSLCMGKRGNNVVLKRCRFEENPDQFWFDGNEGEFEGEFVLGMRWMPAMCLSQASDPVATGDPLAFESCSTARKGYRALWILQQAPLF